MNEQKKVDRLNFSVEKNFKVLKQVYMQINILYFDSFRLSFPERIDLKTLSFDFLRFIIFTLGKSFEKLQIMILQSTNKVMKQI